MSLTRREHPLTVAIMLAPASSPSPLKDSAVPYPPPTPILDMRPLLVRFFLGEKKINPNLTLRKPPRQ